MPFTIDDKGAVSSLVDGDYIPVWVTSLGQQKKISKTNMASQLGALAKTPVANQAVLTALEINDLSNGEIRGVEDVRKVYQWQENATTGDLEPDDKGNPGVDPGYWIDITGGGFDGNDEAPLGG